MKDEKKRKWGVWKLILPLILCMYSAVYAAGQEQIRVTADRWIDYPHYWGVYGTRFYTAHTADGEKRAYCMEPDKNSVPEGAYTAEMIEGNDELRAALYYGYGGPGQSQYIDTVEYQGLGECSVEDAKYVLTHLAASYFYDPEHAFHNMDAGDIANSGVWDFIHWLENREVPSVSSRFSKSSLTAYCEQGTNFQRTDGMEYLSEDSENQIVISCPQGVKLHNESTGAVGTGQVTVKAGERFYFSAPLTIVSSLGEVWTADAMTGNRDGRWEAMKIPAASGEYQVSGYGCYSKIHTEPIQFQVRFIALGNLEIQKKDQETGKSSPQGKGSLQGAVYTVYQGQERIGSIETDQNGYGTLEKIPAGTYTVKETKAPLGYELDPKTYTVEILTKAENQTVLLVSEEKPIKVKIKIRKTDDDTGQAAAQGKGSLKGAEYTVYAGENIGTLKKDTVVGKIVTGEDGTGSIENLLPGNYYIQETKASPGYFLDKTKYEITFPLDGSKTEAELASREKPVKGSIEVQKADAETKENKPQITSTTFEGVVYGIYAEENIGTIKKGEKVTEIVTDKNGRGKAENLLWGTYRVKEIKAPEGYLPDEKEYTAEIPQAAEGSTSLRVLLNSYDKPIRGDVAITKFLKEKEGENASKKPGEGIQFTFTEVGNEKNQVTVTTDKNGYATTKNEKYPDGRLLYGTYQVKESKVPEGYAGVTPFEVTISENQQSLYYILENREILCPVKIIKTAEDTGKVIAQQGTQFKIQKKIQEKWQDQEFVVSMYPKETRQTVFETDESGSFYLPEKLNAGLYRVVEVKAPKGYALSKVPLEFSVYNGMELEKGLEIRFADKVQMGRILLEKKDKDTGSGVGEGFTFSVTAGEDIYTKDGTLRLKKGKEADRITTDEEGKAETKELYPGKYLLKEEETGEFYAGSEEVYEVVLKAEEAEEKFQIPYSVENSKTKIKIRKTENESSDKVLENAEFRLYTEEPADTGRLLITDDKGEITVEDLLHDTVYYLVETKAPEGYVRDETIHKIQVDEKGWIEGKERYCLNLENAPVQVEISKKDEETKKELSDAILELLDENGKTVRQWKTTEKPEIIKCLKPGKYVLREKQAPKGYETASEIAFEVKETQEVQKVEMKDAYLKGKIVIKKQDKETKEILGAGFQFEIRAAEDIRTPAKEKIWKKGDLIETIVTDENGIAQSQELFPGKYQIKEVMSGEYYAVDESIKEAEIRLSEKNEVRDRILEMDNSRTTFYLEKTDAETKEPLEKVVFAVVEKEALKGEKATRENIEKYGQIFSTDKQGKIQMQDMKHGTSWYLTEIKSREGYSLDTTVYEFQVDEKGQIHQKSEFVLAVSNKKEIPEVVKTEGKQETKKQEIKTETVKTGDKSMPAVFLVLGIASAACIAVSVKYRRK